MLDSVREGSVRSMAFLGGETAERAFAVVGIRPPCRVFPNRYTRTNRDSTGCCPAGFAGLETFPAKDRPSLRGSERNCGFTPALGTNCRRLHSSRSSAPFGRNILPFPLTRFTALGFVFEILLVIKLLFSRGEDEVRPAVHTF